MNLPVIPRCQLRKLFKDNTEILRLFKAHRIRNIRDPQPRIPENTVLAISFREILD